MQELYTREKLQNPVNSAIIGVWKRLLIVLNAAMKSQKTHKKGERIIVAMNVGENTLENFIIPRTQKQDFPQVFLQEQ